MGKQKNADSVNENAAEDKNSSHYAFGFACLKSNVKKKYFKRYYLKFWRFLQIAPVDK